MLKLRRLRIEKFRNLAKDAELSFSDGLNVLVGQNGTGKTTLLELISMIVRSDFSSLAKEEFSIEYELAKLGEESIVVRVRNERVPVATDQLSASLGLGARETFRCSAEVLSGTSRQRILRYDQEHGLTEGDKPPISPTDIPSCLERGFLFLYLVGSPVAARISASELVQSSNALRFDESLDLFRKLTGTPGRLANVFVSLEPRKLLSHPVLLPFIPRDVIQHMVVAYEPTKLDYSFTHDELGFLISINDMMGFSSSEIRMDVVERSASRGVESIHLGNLVFRFWWEDGTFITHERLSYGQKRLVAFFYYLACNPAIVIADELVNGLHHRWLTAAVEAVGQRQAFFTSQNPLLLDYIPITSAEQVRHSFVLCRGEPRNGPPGWIWENMSEEDSQELFSAYEVGIEHVSEILQSRGLW